MTYETDPVKLSRLTPEEWDALLMSVWSAPVPREVIRLGRARARATKAGEVRPIAELPCFDPAHGSRRDYINNAVADGFRKGDVARSLGVSLSMVSHILSGRRN